MECKGLVTKVDPYYGYFELNNRYKVYMGVLKSCNKETLLPSIGSRILAKNLHKCVHNYIACSTSIINGDLKVNFKSNSFTNLIRKYKLGSADLKMIDQTLIFFESTFSFDDEDLKRKIFVLLLENVIKVHLPQRTYSSHVCLNQVISHIKITSIKSCKHVQIISKNFEEFPFWSFGIHSKPKDYMIFGFLYIDPQYGFLMFKDCLHKMVFIMTNKQSDINHLQNCYVLIKKFQVVTEIFKDSKVPNLEYIIVDFKNILVVHSAEKETRILGLSLPSEQNFSNTFEFTLLRKSTVCIGFENNPEIYLQILINVKNGTKTHELCYLTIPSQYVTIILHLNESFNYKLHYNIPLKKIHNSELTSLEKLENYLLVDKNAYFQEIDIVYDDPFSKILSIEECKEQKMLSLFTFEGVIKDRGFVEKFTEPRKRTSLYGFSTPGPKTHSLMFGDQLNENNTILTLYLSNWVNKLMPLGLIPQMRVRVRNVQLNKTYIKSTILTYIEIVSYEPTIPFRTANLYDYFEYDWGSSYFLSKGKNIPPGVIIWSKVINVHILELKMTYHCKNCTALIQSVGPCSQCKCEERNLKFFSAIHADDEYGISKVLIKDSKFLKVVLDITEQQFTKWLEAFRSVGEFSFNIHGQDNQCNEATDAGNFKNLFTLVLVNFNKSLVCGIELKCRKLFENTKKYQTKGDYPMWFYLDSRINIF